MSAAELRELAGNLPLPPSSTANLPGLPAYLPTQSYVKNSAKYVVGPAALDRIGAPLPSQLVDFNAGAEVVLGNYEALRWRSYAAADLLSHAANCGRTSAANPGGAAAESATAK